MKCPSLINVAIEVCTSTNRGSREHPLLHVNVLSSYKTYKVIAFKCICIIIINIHVLLWITRLV